MPQVRTQFPLVLLSMLFGTVPVSIIGTRFAMAQNPFWQPDQYGELQAERCGLHPR